jgi:hypothetical protein
VEQTALNHRGPDNTVDGALTVDLAPEGAGTLLRYHSTAKLAGPIALAHPRSFGCGAGGRQPVLLCFKQQVRSPSAHHGSALSRHLSEGRTPEHWGCADSGVGVGFGVQ